LQPDLDTAPGLTEPPSIIPEQGGMPGEAEAPPAPAKPTPAEPQAGVAPAAKQTSGVIGVWVPADARVIINGLETRSTGRHREYVSYGFKPGAVYKYEVRAQIARDGRLIESTRTVYLTAGAHQRVAFHFDAKPEEAIAAAW
jgi:uncharacterized protein (TIGR03000 family)